LRRRRNAGLRAAPAMIRERHRWRLRWARRGLICALIFLPLSVSAGEALSLFDEAAALVKELFFDPKMNGLDWSAVAAEHRALLTPETAPAEFAREFNRLLSKLNASHTVLLTREDLDWYHLVGVFIDGNEPLREALRPLLPDGAPVYTGLGVLIEARAADYFVIGVLQGFPAEAAGILVGDRIVSAEGEPFHPIRSLAGRSGRPTRLVVERTPGERLEISVTPALIDGRTVFEKAMDESAEVIPREGSRIGYIRIWSYAGQKYQSALLRELTNGSLKDADALVLDLRGGLGGADPSYLNIFSRNVVEAYGTDRSGVVQKYSSGWAKPVVLLVDEGSRSGKELFAFGFRKLAKGPIVGERTAGAVLAGRINALSDGSVLFIAAADVEVEEGRLEGRGVEPDILVPFDPAYAAGADPQRDRALEVAADLVERAANQ
jgi:carboxyl-terminal processing protease